MAMISLETNILTIFQERNHQQSTTSAQMKNCNEIEIESP